MPTMPTTDLHIAITYPAGVGHIDARGERTVYLVTFYGPRVVKRWATTLERARFILRRIGASS
jgi:hypothetical protein